MLVSRLQQRLTPCQVLPLGRWQGRGTEHVRAARRSQEKERQQQQQQQQGKALEAGLVKKPDVLRDGNGERWMKARKTTSRRLDGAGVVNCDQEVRSEE